MNFKPLSTISHENAFLGPSSARMYRVGHSSRFTTAGLRSSLLNRSTRLRTPQNLEVFGLPTTHLSAQRQYGMTAKRKEPATSSTRPPAKRSRPEVPDYHLAESARESDGTAQWPAPRCQINRAREIIKECADARKDVLIVPDKDADGLSAGSILRHTLHLLGLPKDLIHIHLLSKGNTVSSDSEKAIMASYDPSYAFVIDHGSRAGPQLIENCQTLIIDHHFATSVDFPNGSEHVTACSSPPVATSALLTYEICRPLHPEVATQCDWLCIVGTHGDLGNTLKWQPPFPDMSAALKRYTKKALNEVVSLVNAPRRTATYDVVSAWDALADTSEPATILQNARLRAARAEVNAEVERCTHAAPKFSADGKVACFRIRSEAQVHPVIATRWAGHLQSKALEIVMVANEGYLPGKVNFSCRVPRCARGGEQAVNIIESLREYASLPPPSAEAEGTDGESQTGAGGKPSLLARMGDDFARGHVQASGGVVGTEEFEELMRVMRVGEKVSSTKSSSKAKKVVDPGQKNNLMSYFGKA